MTPKLLEKWEQFRHEHLRFFECGGCGHWHPFGWTGDCRDDAHRFSSNDLDALFPDSNNDHWPDWLECDESTGELI
jgi:hypothetical protein